MRQAFKCVRLDLLGAAGRQEWVALAFPSCSGPADRRDRPFGATHEFLLSFCIENVKDKDMGIVG